MYYKWRFPMSNLPGFTKVGLTKFSELEMDKTFNDSMKQLNHDSTEYDWFFTKLHNEWENLIDGKSVQSTLEINTSPESKDIDNLLTYSYMEITHRDQIGIHHSSLGDFSLVDPAQKVYSSVGTYYLEDQNGVVESTHSNAGGFTHRTNQNGVSIFSCHGSSVNGKDIVLQEEARHISLNERFEHIVNSERIATYDLTPEDTLTLLTVEDRYSEYTLGKNTIFDVTLTSGEVREYTLEEINGDKLIREIPLTVKSIGEYAPSQENFILDLSDLALDNFSEYAFSSSVGVVLVNESTFISLDNYGRIEGDAPNFTLKGNSNVLIRVVA